MVAKLDRTKMNGRVVVERGINLKSRISVINFGLFKTKTF